MRFENLLEHCYFEKYIVDVSIATLEHGGVTSNITTYQFLAPTDVWAVPKYPEKTVRLTPDEHLSTKIRVFIEQNEAYLNEPECWLGTWVDPYTNICHLDITTLYPCLEDARCQALELSQRTQCNIIALFNCKQQQTVYLWDELNPSSFREGILGPSR